MDGLPGCVASAHFPDAARETLNATRFCVESAEVHGGSGGECAFVERALTAF